MSIGQGQGENKAIHAITQALHHPLLDEVALDNATGIIINFTGGPDLTLFEVEEALNYLQGQTAGQAEVVMGVINDERMIGRVQAILVITGMGGTSLEDALSNLPEVNKSIMQPDRHPVSVKRQQILSQDQDILTHLLTTVDVNDLDVPAFLRRRARMAG